MDGLVIVAIIFVVFVIAIVCFIAFKEIKRVKGDIANKKYFLNNSAQIQKGQNLDEVIALLGRPTSYNEMYDKYILKWEQTEETGFNSISRSVTVVLDMNEIVTDVYRDNIK